MGIVGVFAEDSLEKAHLIVLWDYWPGVSSFTEFLVVCDMSAGCVRYMSTLKDEVSLQATSSDEVQSSGSHE